MSARAPRIGGFGLFGITVILSGAVSLITIPVVVAVAGAGPWASMATGQSIGSAFAALAEFGWGLTGPATVAMTAASRRPALFLDSLAARAVLLVPLVVIQAAVTFAIVPHAKVVALAAGTAMMLAGVSASWYFAGAGRPGLLLALDTAPRVGGTIIGLLLVIATAHLLPFALAQLAGAVVATVASAIVILRGSRLDPRVHLRWRRIVGSLAAQRHGLVATAVSAAFSPAVLAVVAITAPVSLPVFVLADRLIRFAAMALSPMNKVFQGWAPAATGAELVRRLRVSGGATAAAALVAGLGCAVLLPFIGSFLTHGQVSFDVSTAVAFGVFTAVQIGTPFLTSVGLVAVDRVRFIAVSVAVGVPLSLGVLVAVELIAGPEFGPWALASSSAAVAIGQVIALRRMMGNLPLDAEVSELEAPIQVVAAP